MSHPRQPRMAVRTFCLRKRNRLQDVDDADMVPSMESTTNRLVLVPFSALDDTLELTRALIERVPHEDPLGIALRGALANLRAEAILEP